MNLTEEQINTIEEMAELFYSPEEIALNLEVEPEDLSVQVETKVGKIHAAYMRGWLKGDITLRQSIAKAAANGSNPAQQMMLNFQKKLIL